MEARTKLAPLRRHRGVAVTLESSRGAIIWVLVGGVAREMQLRLCLLATVDPVSTVRIRGLGTRETSYVREWLNGHTSSIAGECPGMQDRTDGQGMPNHN